MAKSLSIALICMLLYGILIIPFTRYLQNKPLVEKLGYVPSVAALKIIASDHKEMAGAAMVLKVLMYFGGVAVRRQANYIVAPLDYPAMSRLLHGTVQLDPYNMDAYYFAQAFLTWDARQYKLVNNLMDYGMKYRTWDWYLPFFAGFNSAYFLKDHAAAAEYYKRAGELSGSDLSKLLAGRYMQESGQTGLAIAYLTAMEQGEKNETLKRTFQTRLAAFKEVRRIEQARDRFKEARGVLPTTVGQLLRGGFLSPAPVDPYGGEFYLEPDGKVATTSKFAFGGKSK
jgi:tetratricopeptide (TPR) repeat protein